MLFTSMRYVAELLREAHGIHHDAVTDYIDRTFAENTRGHGAQYETLIAEMQRVTGIGSALKTSDDLVIRGQNIHDFTFAFVAPL